MTTTDHRATAVALVRAADRLLLDDRPGAFQVRDIGAAAAYEATAYATLALAHLGLAEPQERVVFTPGAVTLPEGADGESVAAHLTRASMAAFAEKHAANADPGLSAEDLRACIPGWRTSGSWRTADDVAAVLDDRDRLIHDLADARNAIAAASRTDTGTVDGDPTDEAQMDADTAARCLHSLTWFVNAKRSKVREAIDLILADRLDLERRLTQAEDSLIGLAPAPTTTRGENSVAFLWPHVSDREVSTLGQRYPRLVMALDALAAEAGASRPRQRSFPPAEDAPTTGDQAVATDLPRKPVNDRLTTAERLVSVLSGQHLVLDDATWDALRAAQAAYGIRGVQ